jgi:surface polysaccharide O-acyltransferase-like enzyme
MKTNIRLQNLDIARTIAILMVILIHTIESVEYSKVLYGTTSVSLIKWGIETTLFIIGRIGVPIFCMLSGALMGKRKIENLSEHYKGRVLPLIITTAIWIITYRIFYFFLNGMNYDILSIKSIILEIIFLNPTIANHLWFMPMIIGIYIMMPFINKLIQHLKSREIYIFVILNCIFYSIFPTLNMLLKSFEINIINGDLYTSIDHIFLGGIYLNYYICGYLIINRDAFKNITSRKLINISIVTTILAILSQFMLYHKKILPGVNFFWYDSLYIYIISICCFMLITKSKINLSNKTSNLIYSISRFSFGIYLIHRIFMDFTIKYLNFLSIKILIQMIIVYLITFFLSYLALKIISLNQYASRILINLKVSLN